MELPAILRNLKRSRVSAPFSRVQWRAAVTRNLSLKVFALVLAVLMWGFVASQKRGETTEIKFSTALVFKNIPPSLEVASAPIQSVSVLVRARRARANAVNPNQFQVAIDLSNQLAGSFEYALTERNLSYNNISPLEGMSVLQISPAQIPITLEETIQKVVNIEARLAGDLLPGYKLESVRMVPDRVTVQGPRSVLDKIKIVLTRPLDVQDLRSNVEMLAYLDLPGPVRLAPNQKSFFRAQIDVSGHTTRLLLRDIPVKFENATNAFKASRDAVNVQLEGPRDVMAALNRNAVTAVLDLAKFPPGDYRGLSPQVLVPDTVRVMRQWPIIDLYVHQRKAE
jgi:YbbR domain-containing protein